MLDLKRGSGFERLADQHPTLTRARIALFDRELRRIAAGPKGTPQRVRPDGALLERPKALGYLP